MNKTNIFVQTRELANSLVLKSRELINSLVFKSRELVNSLVFTKMLVTFIFRLWGIRKFLAIHILVFHLSIYYNGKYLLGCKQAITKVRNVFYLNIPKSICWKSCLIWGNVSRSASSLFIAAFFIRTCYEIFFVH